MSNPAPRTLTGPASGMLLAGKYRVIRRIGQGGMGVVLEAENTVSGKRVAIKWLHATSHARDDAEQRIVREARASARVRHPNVVDVYDVVQDDNAVFLVMELLEGEPLSALIDRGTAPAFELIALLIDAMRGVAAAHKQGVVHRDIKPENIFLARQLDRDAPVVKVVDFGISKLLDGEGVRLTRSGVTLGTPLYMSFEQLRGHEIDGRTDVYAFGVILYEALTGQPPFDASTVSELIVRIATSYAVAPRTLRPELPAALERVVQHATARDRTQRTPSLEVLIQDLEPFATERLFRAQLAELDSTVPAVLPRSSRALRPHTGASESANVSASQSFERVRLPSLAEGGTLDDAPVANRTSAPRRQPRNLLPLIAMCCVLLGGIAWFASLAWKVATRKGEPLPAASAPIKSAAQMGGVAPKPAVAPPAQPATTELAQPAATAPAVEAVPNAKPATEPSPRHTATSRQAPRPAAAATPTPEPAHTAPPEPDEADDDTPGPNPATKPKPGRHGRAAPDIRAGHLSGQDF